MIKSYQDLALSIPEDNTDFCESRADWIIAIINVDELEIMGEYYQITAKCTVMYDQFAEENDQPAYYPIKIKEFTAWDVVNGRQGNLRAEAVLEALQEYADNFNDRNVKEIW